MLFTLSKEEAKEALIEGFKKRFPDHASKFAEAVEVDLVVATPSWGAGTGETLNEVEATVRHRPRKIEW